MVEIAAGFMDKVEEQAVAAAAAEDDDEDVAGSVNGDEVEMEPVEPMPEPPDDAGPVCWPMPDFCPLTLDGAVKESFLETLRKEKDAEELLGEAEPGPTPSPDSRPSSSKRQRAVAGSPSSRSPCPYSNLLQVFQQCKQDVA
ncbi:hypothetical protein CFC21_108098 [Triticum aestivum]|uniref:Uncharacterized protein n=3 Tax=Triticinae TaxID=1648030 RepID=A0A9R1MI61_WHEAT|nr:uncharacterized protein LOC109754835 [Aegilops tauschii subsp. strangulata]XP_044440270.1 uncharacterized protein LOC123166528 [Triticum aestivum]KAF7107481.1 hypothetical protein CFC21_108098 [Triticum aestivum]